MVAMSQIVLSGDWAPGGFFSNSLGLLRLSRRYSPSGYRHEASALPRSAQARRRSAARCAASVRVRTPSLRYTGSACSSGADKFGGPLRRLGAVAAPELAVHGLRVLLDGFRSHLHDGGDLAV